MVVRNEGTPFFLFYGPAVLLHLVEQRESEILSDQYEALLASENYGSLWGLK
jgi:hypothetical protein